MFPFNRAPCPDRAALYLEQALKGQVSGDGPFTKKCSAWLEGLVAPAKVLLTTSGSHALEMAARLCGLAPGDEVLMASYTFSSTANAFTALGARVVFVDIRPDTMNLDEGLIEEAITERTRVVVPMHYAGVACEMAAILEIARRHNLLVVEDAAQAVMAGYRGRALGGLGDFGCYSFHETKNYCMGEGGALVVSDAARLESAEIMREKGTNRSQFFRGQVDKYSWMDWGSSYLPSDLNAAYLWSQLEIAEEIRLNRLASWTRYRQELTPLAERGAIELPVVPDGCEHNAHLFYIKAADLEERSRLIARIKQRGCLAVYHYVPLHSAPAGLKFGRFHGRDRFTTSESERLLRLPLYYRLEEEALETAVQAIISFYRG
ncbi:MAG: dTDP-4-amino-4,6-dideoxygalactose transaminase [Candidatus Adiutrix sp.]|nr:dTDP-4-amino-4,6-dideoxygalactose transaminase [Candidatus Adiutrix sp.]